MCGFEAITPRANVTRDCPTGCSTLLRIGRVSVAYWSLLRHTDVYYDLGENTVACF